MIGSFYRLFCGICRTAENHGRSDVLNRGAAAQLHSQFEIFAQQIQDAFGAILSVDGQTPWRMMDGIRVDREHLALDAIKRVGPGGHFLDKPHTARHFRDEHWRPGIWSRQMLGPWLANGQRLLRT